VHECSFRHASHTRHFNMGCNMTQWMFNAQVKYTEAQDQC
jgi:hypothetical protein